MKKISCVIPTYNEEKAIANTLKSVLAAGDVLSEIIVVDDGSKDKTVEIASSFPTVKLSINEENLGKAGTVAKGINEATGDYVLLLDADLLGLEAHHLSALAEPIQGGQADVVISLRDNTPGWMRRLGVDCMSGERILPNAVLKRELESIGRVRRFGLEVFLNRVIIRERLAIKSVPLIGVKNVMKWEKRSFWRGVKDEFWMWVDLFKTVSLWEFLRQQKGLKKLLVK